MGFCVCSNVLKSVSLQVISTDVDAVHGLGSHMTAHQNLLYPLRCQLRVHHSLVDVVIGLMSNTSGSWPASLNRCCSSPSFYIHLNLNVVNIVMELIIYLLIGAIAGFTAGLFGCGRGGLITVPILCICFYPASVQSQRDYAYGRWVLPWQRFCDFYQFGDGTSSARGGAYGLCFINVAHRSDYRFFPTVRDADYLSGQGLQLMIGFFCRGLGGVSECSREAHTQIDPNQKLPSTPVQIAAGGGIGVASAIFRIGGGSVTVPFLENRCGHRDPKKP